MQTLSFDNTFVRELPADPATGPGRRQVHGALYSRVEPTPVAAPRLVAWSLEVAALLDIDPADIESPAFAQVFGGNALLDGGTAEIPGAGHGDKGVEIAEIEILHCSTY